MSYYRTENIYGPQKQHICPKDKVVAGNPVSTKPLSCDCSFAEHTGTADSLKEPFISSGEYQLMESFGGSTSNLIYALGFAIVIYLVVRYLKK